MDDSLVHHGIKGQIWGVRRFQNEDGSRTDLGRQHENALKKSNRAVSGVIRSESENPGQNRVSGIIRSEQTEPNGARVSGTIRSEQSNGSSVTGVIRSNPTNKVQTETKKDNNSRTVSRDPKTIQKGKNWVAGYFKT